AVAETPARHRVRLREPIEDDQQILEPGKAGDRGELAVVEERLVDLVGEDGDAMAPGDLGDALELADLEHPPRRVLRPVDDDELRPGGGLLLEQRQVEAEAARLAKGNRHRHAAHEIDHGLVDGKSRIRINHLVTGIYERRDDEVHDGLGARRDHHLLGSDVDVPHPGDILRDGLAQLGQARPGPVVRGAFVECALRRLADVDRSVEIRFADLEVDDLLALALERLRARQDLERGFGAEPGHAVSDVHEVSSLGSEDARLYSLAWSWLTSPPATSGWDPPTGLAASALGTGSGSMRSPSRAIP